MNDFLQNLHDSVNVSFKLKDLKYLINEDTESDLDNSDKYLSFSEDNINYLQCIKRIESFSAGLSDIIDIEYNKIYSELITMCLAYFNEDDLRYLNFKLSFETITKPDQYQVKFYLKFNNIPPIQYNNPSQPFLTIKATYCYFFND